MKLCRDRAGEFLARLRHDAYANLTASNGARLASGVGPFVMVPGWTNIVGIWKALAPLLRGELGTGNLTVVEVGAWKGGSANAMSWALKAAPAIRGATVNVVSVDTWLGAPEFWNECCIDAPDRGGGLGRINGYPSVYYEFTRNLWRNGHDDVSSPLPLSSLEAQVVLRDWNVRPEAVYVDAAHETAAAFRDMEAWWPLLKSGGVLFGDDAKNTVTPQHVEKFCLAAAPWGAGFPGSLAALACAPMSIS